MFFLGGGRSLVSFVLLNLDLFVVTRLWKEIQTELQNNFYSKRDYGRLD